MRKWGKRSKRVYDTLDVRLQMVCDYILEEVADVSLIFGHRGREEQTILYENGFSKLPYPKSKHNKSPSLAVDWQPYPYPSSEHKLWASLGYIAGRAMGYAEANGFSLRWGGDWDGDGDTTDQTFDDLFHIEISDSTIKMDNR